MREAGLWIAHQIAPAMAAFDRLPREAAWALAVLALLAFMLAGIVWRQARELCLARRVVRWYRRSRSG